MNILIIYDSFFGNTERIAREIGRSFSPSEDPRVMKVHQVHPDLLVDLDLLIIGSPTRKFRPSPAITDFLKGLPKNSLEDVEVAAFDTRISLEKIDSPTLRFIVKTGGYAAKSIARRLQRRGGRLVVPPEGFLVKDTEGPLLERELARALVWGEEIQEKLVASEVF